MKYTIGAKIKKIRLRLNLTQTQMGALIHMSQNSYSRLETNEVAALFEQIINIAYKTKASLFEFFPDDLSEIHQINFNMQMQDYYNEIQDLKKEVAFQRELSKELKEKIKSLNEQILVLCFTPPPPAEYDELMK
jgi:transcriptional regulator with XRE-family HTH domain